MKILKKALKGFYKLNKKNWTKPVEKMTKKKTTPQRISQKNKYNWAIYIWNVAIFGPKIHLQEFMLNNHIWAKKKLFTEIITCNAKVVVKRFKTIWKSISCV